MKGLLEHLAATCNVMLGGAFIGGVVFNTLGAGQDLRNAGIGFSLMLVFLLLGCFLKLKGGK